MKVEGEKFEEKMSWLVLPDSWKKGRICEEYAIFYRDDFKDNVDISNFLVGEFPSHITVESNRETTGVLKSVFNTRDISEAIDFALKEMELFDKKE